MLSFMLFLSMIPMSAAELAQCVEQKLAAIDGRISVDQFKTQIDSIAKKCRPTTREHIADLGVLIVQKMKDRGRTEALFQVIRAMNESIPDNFVKRCEIEKVTAAIIVMATSPEFRNDKLEAVTLSLRDLLKRNPNFLDSLAR